MVWTRSDVPKEPGKRRNEEFDWVEERPGVKTLHVLHVPVISMHSVWVNMYVPSAN